MGDFGWRMSPAFASKAMGAVHHRRVPDLISRLEQLRDELIQKSLAPVIRPAPVRNPRLDHFVVREDHGCRRIENAAHWSSPERGPGPRPPTPAVTGRQMSATSKGGREPPSRYFRSVSTARSVFALTSSLAGTTGICKPRSMSLGSLLLVGLADARSPRTEALPFQRRGCSLPLEWAWSCCPHTIQQRIACLCLHMCRQERRSPPNRQVPHSCRKSVRSR